MISTILALISDLKITSQYFRRIENIFKLIFILRAIFRQDLFLKPKIFLVTTEDTRFVKFPFEKLVIKLTYCIRDFMIKDKCVD
jgi:hypothetical protein